MEGLNNYSDELFLKALGDFIKAMRVAAGYPTIRSFVDTVDMSYSQYQGYESGKNITIKKLKEILNYFGLTPKDWLKIDLENTEFPLNMAVERLEYMRIKQVMSQVEVLKGREESLSLKTIEIERFIKILIACHEPKTRSFILKDIVKMEDSHNTFKRVAGKLLDYGWLDFVDKESKNSPEQAYYTTVEGKNLLKQCIEE